MAALAAHARRPLFLIAESDLNDPRLRPRPRGRRLRPRRRLGRRVASRAARHADRRDGRLLRGLRAAAAAGQGAAPGLGVRRHLLPAPPAGARPLAGRAGGQPVRGRHPEPRPGRQPRRGRAQRRPDERGPAAGGRRPAADLAVRADAVPGRGVGRGHAVPVLHRATPIPGWAGRSARGGGRSSPPSAGIPPTCPIRRIRPRSSAPGWTGPSRSGTVTPACWPGTAS